MTAPMRDLTQPTGAHEPEVEFAIIGAGIAGLGIAWMLKSQGFTDFVVLERGDDIGGVWRDNRYPGVAVDIPSHAYQFSYFPKPDWSRMYPRGSEVKAYLDEYVDHYGLWSHIRLNSGVTRRTWNEQHHYWELAVGGEVLTTRWVISAVGNFLMPRSPNIAGLDGFDGDLLYSQRWDESCDLRGKRVAVVGTGASAVQIVPEIAEQVAHLDVYQRTPIWIVPKLDPPMPALLQRTFRRHPRVQQSLGEALRGLMERLLIGGVLNYQHKATRRAVHTITWLLREVFYRRCVPDPSLRGRLTPAYGFGCKRPSLSSTYLRAFNQPHVDLICDPIDCVTRGGIRTADGVDRPVDVIVLATGFHMAYEPEPYRSEPVVGRAGFDIAECFATQRSRSYEGVSIPGLPNYLFVYGPYGGTGGTYHDTVEMAGRHIVRVIREARRRGATCVEITEHAADRWTTRMRERASRTLFYNNSCQTANSYYFDRNGDLTFLRPEGSAEAFAAQATFALDDYQFETKVPARAVSL